MTTDDRISPEPPRRMRRYSPNVHRHRRELRLNLMPMERLLWEHLRNRNLEGVKFRRQHPIDSFVLDFYAPELRLAVELDGDVHETPKRKAADARRQRRLEEMGVQVVRITNEELTISPDHCLDRIREAIHAKRASQQ
jgi:very-short-patch-repair endonuclease